jgi:predicted enzyme related to lactoylglutathione lyase
MSPVSVRYIADDVESATAFYRDNLGFTVEMSPAPGFAMLSRGEMPDGRMPEAGGWNRIQLEVEDLAAEVEALRKTGARFRNEIVTGRGGKQILLEDPSGNPIELFQPG